MTVRSAAVPRFVNLTDAPGTSAPELSLTVPTIDPKVDCARVHAGDKRNMSARQGRANAVLPPRLLFEDRSGFCSFFLCVEESCSSDVKNSLRKRRSCNI